MKKLFCPDVDLRVIQCDLTNYCNLQCIMCSNLGIWKGERAFEKKVMPDEIWDRICEVGVKEIWLGFAYEPMLDRSIWQKVLKYHRLHNSVFFSIISNGLNFDEEDINIMRDIPFRVVNISLNGGDRETVSKIMGFHVWDQAWWTIKNLLILKDLHIVVSSVFLNENRESNYRLIDKVSKMNTGRISISIGHPNQTTNCLISVPVSEKYREEFANYKNYGKERGIDVIENKREFEFEDIDEFWERYDICSKLWRRIHISYNGDIRLCCERTVKMGNIKDASIMDIIKGGEFDSARNSIWKNEGPCKGCRVIAENLAHN